MTRVRTVRSEVFTAYQAKRVAKLIAFAPMIELDRWLVAHGRPPQIPRYSLAADHIAFHPWLPGFVDAAEVPAAWRQDGPIDLDGLVTRAVVDFAALQHPVELRMFLEHVRALAPRTILEIGSSCGGSLFAIAQVAAPDATLVSIDLPERMDTPAIIAAIPELFASLVQPTQTLHAIRDRSTLHAVRSELVAKLGGRPLDLLVVDGDHSYGGVSSDLAMYAPLVRRGGLIALHDAVVVPDNSGRGYEAGLVWQELQERQPHSTELIVAPDAVPGIHGRPASFGWGLIRP